MRVIDTTNRTELDKEFDVYLEPQLHTVMYQVAENWYTDSNLRVTREEALENGKEFIDKGASKAFVIRLSTDVVAGLIS